MGMLVLTRLEDEDVIITFGDTRIRLVVAEIRGMRVRLAFDAPPDVKIHRGEIQKQVDHRAGDKGEAP